MVVGPLIDGATAPAVTVSVNDCVALGAVPLLAVIVKVCAPTAVAPVIVIRPVELLMVTPVGAPVKLYVMGVVPEAATWKVPPVPNTTEVLFADVMVGATGAAAGVAVAAPEESPLPLLLTARTSKI